MNPQMDFYLNSPKICLSKIKKPYILLKINDLRKVIIKCTLQSLKKAVTNITEQGDFLYISGMKIGQN